MPVLISSRHELFAQLRSKGLSAVDAYLSAGYSKSNARSNASRLSANDSILARIKELQTDVAERVVAAEARRPSWRVELLQKRIDKALALSQARATMYANEMGEEEKATSSLGGEDKRTVTIIREEVYLAMRRDLGRIRGHLVQAK